MPAAKIKSMYLLFYVRREADAMCFFVAALKCLIPEARIQNIPEFYESALSGNHHIRFREKRNRKFP